MYTNSKLSRRAGIYHIDLIPSLLNGHFIGFNLIYWMYICGKYFLMGSLLENLEKKE